MKHTKVTDEMLAEVRTASPTAERRDIHPPPGSSGIGIASTIVEIRDGVPTVWAPYELEDGDLDLLREGEAVWFAQLGTPILPFIGAIDPWGVRRFGARRVAAASPTRDLALPEVLQDEDGDRYFAYGHIDPRVFLLACILDTAENFDDTAALDLVRSTTSMRIDFAASRFLNSVYHGWFKERADNDELMDACEPGDEGAQPFTSVTL